LEDQKDLKYRPKLRIDDIRRQQYLYHANTPRKGYTWFKTKLYMECASFVVYWCQNWNPNIITFLYLISSMIGTMLMFENKACVLMGLIIFYFRGVLDWSDGHIARLQNKVTEFGKVFDMCSGFAGALFFYFGVGVYVSNLFHLYPSWVCLWVFMALCILKLFDVKVSRAYVIDAIIFIVGVLLLVT